MMTVHPTVTDGLRKFLRLQQLPLQEYQLRQNADVFDLIEAIDAIRVMYADTSRMIGKQMHQTSQYDPAEDVKCAIEEWLLVGDCERETAHLRKKHLTMYHLVLEPIVDMLSVLDHATAIQEAAVVANQLTDYVVKFDAYGTADDALVAKHQIKAMVKQREEVRRLKKEAAKKSSRRRKREDVEVVDISEETDIDD